MTIGADEIYPCNFQRIDRLPNRWKNHDHRLIPGVVSFLQSFHAELHQYKHQIEQFNQLTQKLIAVYQEDDTTRVKKMTETINQRYNNLNSRYVALRSFYSLFGMP